MQVTNPYLPVSSFLTPFLDRLYRHMLMNANDKANYLLDILIHISAQVVHVDFQLSLRRLSGLKTVI